MAMMDYGAIAWKDGKLISTDMFTNMKDMVGWTDNGEHKLEGNYFAYIGDEDLTIGFYKYIMKIHCPNGRICKDDTIFFGSEKYKGWTKWCDSIFIDNLNLNYVDIKVTPVGGHDYYICKMKYRGHKYKVAFGYGVDLDYYKKFHIIDYYGTPWFKAKELYNKIKDRIKYGY